MFGWSLVGLSGERIRFPKVWLIFGWLVAVFDGRADRILAMTMVVFS
jgi:hypothetical protein